MIERLSILYVLATLAGCVPGGSGTGTGSSQTSAKNCADLNATDCETTTVEGKTCRVKSGTCTEIKTCFELTELGQAACKADALPSTKCEWLSDRCLTESKLLADFKSKPRVFFTTKFVAKPVPHSELADTFGEITTIGSSYNYSNIEFAFDAPKSEVSFSATKAGGGPPSPYKFTYKAADLSDDLMVIELKGTTPKTGTVMGKANVDIVEPFNRALLLYQKSTNKLYFLIVYTKAEMDKFAKIKNPADFVFDATENLQGLDAFPHTAFIMDMVP
jgi:hypothetical protein